MRRLLPLALLVSACTQADLEELGRVLIESSSPPVIAGASTAPSQAPSAVPSQSLSASPSLTPSAKPPSAGPSTSPAPSGWSETEQELYRLLMAYRAEKGLASIPLSPSLTRVARLHVDDLNAHPPEEPCNMHSWSASGTWTPMCYTDDHAEAEKMWNKPRELTTYPGNGYEISHGGPGARVTPASAMKGWKGSSGHNAVMINGGTWATSTWQAVGVAIRGSYTTIWFGEEVDPAL